jgi:hypothetical protein
MSWKLTILLNIVGGILAGLAVLGLQWLYYLLFNARPFRKFFGANIINKYNIIYCLYNMPKCPKSDSNCKLICGKKDRQSAGPQAYSGKNLQEVTSIASASGVGYLVEAFSKNIRKSPTISSDVDPTIEPKTDISFVSIGGITNYKTCDLLSKNRFLEYIDKPLSVRTNGQEIARDGCAGPDNDFGFIVKIHPDNDYERTWICCFGFGIVGTIGATYPLANKWRQIRSYVGYQPFGLVLRSTAGSEDSSVPLHLIISKTWRIRDWIVVRKCRRNGINITLV